MSLIPIVLVLAVAGFVCWIVLQIPMPAVFRNVIMGVICFILVVWLLQSLGFVTGLGRVRL